MNNEIINEINIFVKTIKDSKIYKEYITLLEKVNKSEEIKVLVTDIRNIQKKLVKNPSIELENILKQKQAELNDIPIYLDYKDKIEELNNVLLTVKDKFDSFIEELNGVNSNIEILTGVAKKENVKILPPVYLTENHRAKNDELRSLEKNMYFIKTPYEKEVKNISIYRAKSIVDECNYVSSEISKLMRQGINPSDITVICRDLDKYQRELQFSFSKYNIPYFDDERQSISSQPCVMFINFLFRLFFAGK